MCLTTVPAADWEAFRAQMPVARQWAYFDHAAVAPLSDPARQAIAGWSEDSAANGDVHWKKWSDRVGVVRGRGARLLGADEAEIAVIRNTTEGINLVAEGFPWRPGDNVVVPADEFPSNLFPWLHLQGRGVEVRQVDSRDGQLDLARLAAACDARTRVVAVSWVGYATGWRNDVDALADIAHRHGGYLFLDAIQGLGVLPLDVRRTPVDFLSADGHKWLLGPEGAGIFYLRRQHLDLLRPLGVGWNSVVQAGDYANHQLQFKPTAARYEGGTYHMPGVVGLAGSLDLLAGYDLAATERRILEVTDLACEHLRAVGALLASDRRPEHKSGIVAFELPGRNPVAVRRRCLDRGVVLSCRAGRLRISPHLYTNLEDIERLCAALAEAD